MFNTLIEVLENNKTNQNPILDLSFLTLNGTEPALQTIQDFYWLDTVIFGSYWQKYNPDECKLIHQNADRYSEYYKENEKNSNNLIVFPNFLPTQLKHLSLVGDIFSKPNIEENTCIDISSLEKLPNLETLNLSYLSAPISNYDVIGTLTNLVCLCISGHNGVKNIDFLKNLTELQYLDISYSQVTNISHLCYLSQLKSLRFSVPYNIEVENLYLLGELKSLIYLDFHGYSDSIQHISYLGQLTNLKELRISDIKNLEDVMFLSNLTRLESLSIWSCAVKDISSLQYLLELKNIHLGKNKITDISPLSNLSNIEYLDLNFNPIKDISPIYVLKNLKTLDLRDCTLKNLDLKSEYCPYLQKLNVCENGFEHFYLSDFLHLEELSVFSKKSLTLINLPKLKSIIQYRSHDDLNREVLIRELSGLEHLNLSLEGCQEYDFFKDLIHLKTLTINDVGSLDFLITLPNKVLLEKLYIYTDKNIKNEDWQCLKMFENIETLEMRNIGLIDISFVEKMSKLKKIYISDNKITSLKPLYNLIYLEEIQCYRNQIEEGDITLFNTKILKYLDITFNPIKKICIKDFPNLQYFYFFNLGIEEIRLHNLPMLKEFRFVFEIDYRVQGEMGNLHTLDIKNVGFEMFALGKSNIKDFSFLEKLPDNLLSLEIIGIKLVDFSFLQKFCKTLQKLKLQNMCIKELEFLKDFPIFENVTYLNLAKNELQNTHFTAHFPSLKKLSLKNNQIEKMEINNLKSIELINWVENPFNKIEITHSNFFCCYDDYNNEESDCEYYSIDDLQGIEVEYDDFFINKMQERLQKETYYKLTPQNIGNLIYLSNVTSLEIENYSNEKITFDIAELLKYTPKVTSLSIYNTKIINIEKFVDLSFLNSLRLHSTGVDIKLLPNIPSVEDFALLENHNICIEHLKFSKDYFPNLKTLRLEANIQTLTLVDLPKFTNFSERNIKNLHIENCPLCPEIRYDIVLERYNILKHNNNNDDLPF